MDFCFVRLTNSLDIFLEGGGAGGAKNPPPCRGAGAGMEMFRRHPKKIGGFVDFPVYKEGRQGKMRGIRGKIIFPWERGGGL